MPLAPRHRPATAARTSRRNAPSCRGGASSMLRLAQPAAPRLDLGNLLSRAADVFKLSAVPAFAPSEFTPG